MRYLLIIISLFILYISTFTIKETEIGIILRFGKVIRNIDNKPIIYKPGLHIKIPFIEKLKILDSRIQTLNVQADRYLTKENKDLIVDSYLKWKINDFNRYYVATDGGNSYQAETLLKRKFSDLLRSEFGRLNVKDIITDSRGRLTLDVLNALNKGIISNINKYNDKIIPYINKNSIVTLGIKIIDFRIKRIELPNEVSEAIYQRMRAEREAVARQHRSQGQEKAVKIRAIADKTVTETLAESERTALKIKGEGDAIATKLFADAFNKEPDFYAFIRSLRAYEKSFNKHNDNIMILSSDMDFLRYMKNPNKKNK